MLIGVRDHLQKWIFHSGMTHRQLNKDDAIWLSLPAYHNLTPKTQSNEDDSIVNGKESKEVSRYLLRVVTQSLGGGCPNEHSIVNHSIECLRALLQFSMYVQYTSRDDVTLSYMEDALLRCHTLKNAFSLQRAVKNTKANVNAVRTDIMKL
jgi:hypothetical protein